MLIHGLPVVYVRPFFKNQKLVVPPLDPPREPKEGMLALLTGESQHAEEHV